MAFTMPYRNATRPYLGDTWLLVMVAVLLAFGLVMMTSASIEIASRQYGDALFHFKRQLVFLFMGLCCALAVLKCPMRYWYKGSVALLMLAYLLLILVLIPGIGREVNGSTRWFRLGFMSLQASEPAKLFIVVFMAWFLGRHRELVRNSWKGFVYPLILCCASRCSACCSLQV
jgi:cell division protein FtsW